MKKISKNTGAKGEKKIDYFAIVRNTPPDQVPKSQSIHELRKRIQKLKGKKLPPKTT